MSILSLNEATLILAGNTMLDKANLQIQPQDRIALVGRNGAGKSTLLNLLQGEFVLDGGKKQQLSGLRIAGLTQEVPAATDEPVYHFLVKGLGELGQVLIQYHEAIKSNDTDKLIQCQQTMDHLKAWDMLPKIETMASKLGIDTQQQMKHLSGGMKRRVLLGAALLASPDLLLLDEPTNHLDLDAIEWLESYLKSYHGSLIVITHDREFLKQVANRIIQIDRGKLYFFDCDYETYLDRREAIQFSEQKQNDLFDKRLAEEEVWIRTGIKARRTRNEGRVRALKALREEYKARRNQLGKAKSINLEVSQSGLMVIEATGVHYSIGDRALIQDFSLLLTRGDKLGIIGPNGCGKTTLVNILLGSIKANSGRVKLGTSLEVAYFDQLRRVLAEDQTLMFNVSDGSDFVTINGKQKHVASYLKEFLFSKEQLNQKVSTLSGGEKNRLLLAKLFAKPVNFLVMDEPTNDLDIETLELLETMLAEYPGTLIIISHDRAFINEVVTSILVYEGEGQFNEFVGGYDDYKLHKKKQPKENNNKSIPAPKGTNSSNKLTFNEQRELNKVMQQIEVLEKDIAKQHASMASSEFYQQNAELITEFNKKLSKNETVLAELYARWEELSEKE